MDPMYSRPWGVLPQLSAADKQRIAMGYGDLDGYLLIMGQVIPWPKSNSRVFAVVDYEKVDFIRLKGNARSRGMTEWHLRRKVDLIAMLREWDANMQNHTPWR
jgi:hypothetical protein